MICPSALFTFSCHPFAIRLLSHPSAIRFTFEKSLFSRNIKPVSQRVSCLFKQKLFQIMYRYLNILCTREIVKQNKRKVDADFQAA